MELISYYDGMQDRDLWALQDYYAWEINDGGIDEPDFINECRERLEAINAVLEGRERF